MYKYSNGMSMSINGANDIVIINFTQNTPALGEDCEFVDTDETHSEIVSSIALDKVGAYSLLEGLIHILDLDKELDAPE